MIRHRLLPASSLPPELSWLTSSSSSPSLLSLAQLPLRRTPHLDINSAITSSHLHTRLVCTPPTTRCSSPTGHRPGHRAPYSRQLRRLHSSRPPPPWGQLELELSWCQRVARELRGEAGCPFTCYARQGLLLTSSQVRIELCCPSFPSWTSGCFACRCHVNHQGLGHSLTACSHLLASRVAKLHQVLAVDVSGSSGSTGAAPLTIQHALLLSVGSVACSPVTEAAPVACFIARHCPCSSAKPYACMSNCSAPAHSVTAALQAVRLHLKGHASETGHAPCAWLQPPSTPQLGSLRCCSPPAVSPWATTSLLG